MKKFLPFALVVLLAFIFLRLSEALPQASKISKETKIVHIYVSLDDIFSRPLLEKFEKQSGIKVQILNDTEMSKTVGLVNRIIAERNNPQCDVFWNNEIIRSIVLQRQGLLETFRPQNAKGIPEQFRNDYWTGFAARARVFIVNTQKLSKAQYPRSSLDFTKKTWAGRFALAKPLFGTTSTHAAALFSLNAAKAKAYFQALKNNDVNILVGNSMVKDSVASGELAAGWTDTDDASLAMERGRPVSIVLPDQKGKEVFPGGLILIPNTVCLIKNAPHPEAARKLIEFILRPETEAYLAACPSAQIPLHPGVKSPENVLKIERLRLAPVDWEKAADILLQSNAYVKQLFSP
jgi:iron(III) transport system substrate-binding protein